MKNTGIYSIIFGVLLLIGAILGFASAIKIDAGNRGVVKHWGKVQNTVLDEGLHFVTPFRTTVVPISVRTQKLMSKSTVSTKDMQQVETQVILNYRVSPQNANILYQKLGEDYEERIISPALVETIKSATAKYPAEQLVRSRPFVKALIYNDIKKRLIKNHIIVESVSITNFLFSSKFTQAIESKQIAEQKALQATNDLKRIQMEGKQRITRAEAQAKEQELLNKTISTKTLKQTALEKWDGKLPKIIVLGKDGKLPFLIDANK